MAAVSRAAVYLRRQRLFIRTTSEVVGRGGLIEEGPCAVLELGAPREVVGAAVVAALDRSSAGFPLDRDLANDEVAVLLDKAEVNTVGEFAASAKQVNVDRSSERINVRPTINMEIPKNRQGGAKRRGFVEIDEAMIALPLSADLAEIGASVYDAIERSR